MGMRNILVVEDDPIFALDLQDLIYECGGNPIGPAHCLQGALELSASYPIDLAIVDVNLSDGPTGLAVARLLTERFGVRTIILSGDLPSPAEVSATEHVFVRKPVPPEVLAEIMGLPADRQILVAS